jgi:hypothetical protein
VGPVRKEGRRGSRKSGRGDGFAPRIDFEDQPGPAAAGCCAGAAGSPRARVGFLYANAALGLYGGQLFWLGAWELADVDTVRHGVFAQTPLRDWLYVLTGMLGLVAMDKWYEEGGLNGSMWRDPVDGKWFGRGPGPPARGD